MPNIQIDSIKLRQLSNEINILNTSFLEYLNNLYTRIENVPINTSEWTGVSAQKFANVLNKLDKEEYIYLSKNISEYSNMISSLADMIETKIKENSIQSG